MNIGAQLYTVRSFCKTPEDFAETLKKVADIGFRFVQVSGSCEVSAKWLHDELKKNGLQCVLTHTAKEKLQGDIHEVVEYHNTIGCDNVGLGHFKIVKEDDSDYEEFKSIYLPVAKALKAEGKQFCYHHHAMEFKKLSNGNTVLEQILEDFTPDECHITMDTFWVQAGGGNPAEWLRRLKGRTEHIHVKDFLMRPWMEKDPKYYFAALGEGILNFDEILKAAEDISVKTLLIEEDDCYGEDPFVCLKRSYDFLKARGYQ